VTSGDLDIKAPEESKNELLAKLGVVINRTVLSLKNTLDALESSRSYLENIIRSMKDSLIVSDSDGRVVLINPATTELLGYGEEIKGRLFSAICIEDAQEGSTFCKDWRERLKEEGFVKNQEAVYKTKFGEEIPVSFSGSLLKDRKAEVVGFVCVAKDMREIKRHIERERMLAMEASKSAEAAKKRAEELYNAYQELKKTQAQLLQAEKLSSIGRLGAGVAHELNSPLTGLLSLLRSYRKESKEGSREHEDFTDMVLAGEHMAKIISDLNSFARISKEELANLSFKDVIESTLSFSEHPLIQKNIKIIKEYAPDLAKVRGDKGKLQQVVLNLLTNAYDAMSNGGSLTIKTRNAENGGQVIVEFIDTGIGIRQEDLLRVFEPFFTTKEPGKGTGLGLYISHGIIETHGGKISVESRVGEGAKFTIFLPAVEKRGA
jgi:two-component system NtrC family sensor kinase